MGDGFHHEQAGGKVPGCLLHCGDVPGDEEAGGQGGRGQQVLPQLPAPCRPVPAAGSPGGPLQGGGAGGGGHRAAVGAVGLLLELARQRRSPPEGRPGGRHQGGGGGGGGGGEEEDCGQAGGEGG